MDASKAVPEKQIEEFVSRLRQAAGENLQSVILYGSAAGGEFHPEFSNINLLCILKQISLSHLQALQPAVAWWRSRKHGAPMLMTREELERSADVFAIEIMDMKQRHRLVFGDDVLSGLTVPMQLHRAQVEYELREKLLLLRGHLLQVLDDQKRLRDLLLSSLGAFTTLFRHALIALGADAPSGKRLAVEQLAARVKFDPSAFLQLIDVREGRADKDKLDAKAIAGTYLDSVQQTVAAVDRMLDSPGARPA